MAEGSFHAFYHSDLQGVYALWVVPSLFLAWLVLTPSARRSVTRDGPDARFVWAYCVVFALETILDPYATGLLSPQLGIAGKPAGTAILITFVLLGDFRVFLLLFRLAAPGARLSHAAFRAAGWTTVVPLAAFAGDVILRESFGPLPSQTIWLLYELAFLALALWMRDRGLARWVTPRDEERTERLRRVATYVAVYYALWALADVLILVFGLDLGWALRVLPNQLYYGFYLPFVYFQLASSRTSAASQSTHASR